VLATIQKGEQVDGQLPFIPKALFLMGGVPLKAGESVVGGVAQQAARAFQRLINR